jgi:hypothetical protein
VSGKTSIVRWAITLIMLSIIRPTLLVAADSGSQNVTANYRACHTLNIKKEKVKENLINEAIKRLAEQVLFKIDFRETFDRSGVIENWVSDGRELYSTRYKEYMKLLSSGTLKNFNYRFIDQPEDNNLCIEASAVGNLPEFRQKIAEIELLEKSLPEPNYVEAFNELPGYHRLD